MNTGRLKELIERITVIESQVKTQIALQALGTELSNLVSQPQNPEHQNRTAIALTDFTQAMLLFETEFPPHEFEHVIDLGGVAFSAKITDQIAQKITENPMTPNVVYDFVQELHEMRAKVLTSFTSISDGFDFFSLGYSDVEEGMAELGFQIPRKFFHNDLDGLIDELSELKRMLRFFSEASLGKSEPAQVGAISTTDPLIFLEMIEPLAVKVGTIVQWALTVWIGVETIRNLRADTAKSQAFTEDEVEDFFGKKIKADINQKVDEKVQELLAEGEVKGARKGELKGQLDWALRALLSKVERGMTVELRIAPPPPSDTDEDQAEDAERSAAHADLKRIQAQLTFPAPSDAPVLEIPHENVESENN